MLEKAKNILGRVFEGILSLLRYPVFVRRACGDHEHMLKRSAKAVYKKQQRSLLGIFLNGSIIVVYCLLSNRPISSQG